MLILNSQEIAHNILFWNHTVIWLSKQKMEYFDTIGYRKFKQK